MMTIYGIYMVMGLWVPSKGLLEGPLPGTLVAYGD